MKNVNVKTPGMQTGLRRAAWLEKRLEVAGGVAEQAEKFVRGKMVLESSRMLLLRHMK
jgi:hypothetical protein